MRVRRLYSLLASEKNELVGLLTDSFPDLSKTEAWALMMTHNNTANAAWYEARHRGACVGACAVTDGLISDLCVLRSMRRRGVARKILAYVVKSEPKTQHVARVLPLYQPFYAAVGWRATACVLEDRGVQAKWEADYPSAAWMAPGGGAD